MSKFKVRTIFQIYFSNQNIHYWLPFGGQFHFAMVINAVKDK